ncbi:unnamed protein product [Urochloa decumbens]|uniref:Protein kinase domain-containing protein n=1 Tax=Urochloa decumbens TaxID=240449 RepID=A0ABC9AKY7_9POAL
MVSVFTMQMPNNQHHRTSSIIQVLLAAVASLLALQLAAASEVAPPMGLPGCPTMCGNVSVPYPFGIGTNCSHPGFNLRCDATHSPPRLLLGVGAAAGVEVTVTNIFLQNATMRVTRHAIINEISYVAAANGTWGLVGAGDDGNATATLLSKGEPLFVSGSGCSASCWGGDPGYWERPIDGRRCSECSGNGCCQASIPMYSPSYDVRLIRLDDPTHYTARIPTIVVYIAERGWIEDVWCQIIGFTGGKVPFPIHPPPELLSAVPVMLEWAMNSTRPREPGFPDITSRCPTNGATSACMSNHSYCIDMNNNFQSGYACQCSPGYYGNPYLSDGCQDINECTDPHRYPCYGECTNLPGTYHCRCRQGFQGNSSVMNGCIDIDECADPNRYPCFGDCINLSGTYQCRCPEGSQGNSSIMHGCVKSSADPSIRQSQKRKGLSIGLGVGSGASLLVLGLGTIILVRKVKARRKKRLRQKFFKQNRGQLLQQLLVCQRADIAERMIVTEEELEKATNNFDKSRELGGGGHGIVYKGILSSQHVVAIKKSKIVIQKEIIEFINEVAILSQVNHKNIVKLIGCCLETEVPLLVYEFISNGTLYSHLNVEASISLSWKDRLRVAVETARALTYLHSLASTPVIHRDIKSPNILLDDMLTVKLSDFGASRYIPVDLKGLDTTVQGTLGYLDPTYHTTGHLTNKSDVYSFGVLLIELLTRKKPTSYRSCQGFALVSHFVGLLSQGNLDQILDPQVAREGDGEIVDIALLAQMCVKSSSEERPTMRQVEILLESIQAAKEFSSDVTDDDRSSGGNSLEVRSCD